MKRVIAWYLVFLIVLSTLAAAQEEASVIAQDSDASAAVKEDQIDSSAAAPGKCGFFCRIENWLREGRMWRGNDVK